jgi:hypothetical protein
MRRDPGTAVHGDDGPARANADAFIARPNPIITGWVAHYRIGVSIDTWNQHPGRSGGSAA